MLNQAGLETHGPREVLTAPVTSRGVLVRPSLPLPLPLPGLKLPIPYFSLTSLSIPPLAAVMYAESEVSESEVAQSCQTLGNPMDCSLPGSSLHGILQARVLEWVAISFSRGSSQLRD